MKKVILVSFVLLMQNLMIAQCPEGRVELVSQQEVDNFKIEYPNCTELSEYLIISYSSIVNLDGLSNIESITDDLIIGTGIISSEYKSTSLINLSGLSSLKHIGGNLTIKYNTELESFSGLDSLEYIGKSITIERNPRLFNTFSLKNLNFLGDYIKIVFNYNLETIPNFGNLQEITGYVRIENTDITNLSSFTGVETIKGRFKVIANNSIIDLDGLQTIKSIGGNVDIAGNERLKTLIGFEGLEFIGGRLLIKNFNGMRGLDDISGLGNLKRIEGDFTINYQNLLTEVSGFESLEYLGGDFTIKDNYRISKFTNLEKLKFIGGGYIVTQNPQLAELPNINGVDSLGGLLSIQYNDLIKDLSAVQNISKIKDRLIIRENELLENIEGIKNIEFDTLFSFIIERNKSLSTCSVSSVCNFVPWYTGNLTIADNKPGCNSREEIIEVCSNNFNTITGKIRIDEAKDGCDVSDLTISDILVINSNGVSTNKTFTNTRGQFSFYVEEGIYTTSLGIDSSYFTTVPNSVETIFTTTGSERIVDFCVESNNVLEDLNVVVLPLSEARPGFESTYKVVYKNIGSTVLNGTVNLRFDNTKLDFTDALPTQDDLFSGMLTWNYSGLRPFESRSVEVNFTIYAPPTTNIDDVLSFTASISPNSADATPNDNIFELNQIVIGSYDPNDKTVLEGDKIFIEEVDEFLHYVIRFQNTGTASAINVRVTDTLTANLDWDTFSPIAFSHEERVQITNDRNIEFIFDDINLPDSASDEDGSNGFIAFKIKPKEGISVGDIIEGKAEIYFDYNPPIITNNVMTVVNDVLSSDKFVNENRLIFVPNPTSGILNFRVNDLEINKVEMYNSLGQKVLYVANKKNIKMIDVSSITKGIYFCRIETSDGSKSVYKVVKR